MKMPIHNTFYDTQEVADSLGVSRSRVAQLLTRIRESGRKIGEKVGNALIFTELEVERIRQELRPNGRPKKSSSLS
jgi:hypothetical protein